MERNATIMQELQTEMHTHTVPAFVRYQGQNHIEERSRKQDCCDAHVFEIYIEQVLLPSLSPGQIVVIDNLSIHAGKKVRQALEARG